MEIREKIPKSEKKAKKREELRERTRIKRRIENKKKRLKIADDRKELLSSMTIDERKKFILDEKDKKLTENEENMIRYTTLKEAGRFKVIIGLDFLNLMNDTELTSLAKQIQWIWNSIRKCDHHDTKLTLLNFDERNLKFVECCNKFGYTNWHFNISDQNLNSYFLNNKETYDFIYLSPDSQNILTEDDILNIQSVFIIGGIVDRTVKKNITKNFAESIGIKHKRLPIKELKLQVSPILNINIMYDIISDVFFGKKDLFESIKDNIPGRKKNKVSGLGRKERRKKKADETINTSFSNIHLHDQI